MWWEKKTRPVEETPTLRPEAAPPAPPEEERHMSEPTPKSNIPSASGGQRTVIGRSVVAQGEITSSEDIVIEGQFDGTITLNEHCLTVGPEGRVKAEIRARQVVVQGSVTGNVEAREKIDIRRTGHVVGDLSSATVAIEEGAYFKGSIDISRGEAASATKSAYASD